MKTLLKKILPTFIYKKLSSSLLLRKYLTRMNLILHQNYVGIYNNQKELEEDLLKKKVPQVIGDLDKRQEQVDNLIERNRNFANDFKNNTRMNWNERESFLCHALTLFPSK